MSSVYSSVSLPQFACWHDYMSVSFPNLCNKNFTLSPLMFLIILASVFSINIFFCTQEEEETQIKLVPRVIILCMWRSSFLTTWNVIIAFPCFSGLWLPKACLYGPSQHFSPHTCLVSSTNWLRSTLNKSYRAIFLAFTLTVSQHYCIDNIKCCL